MLRLRGKGENGGGRYSVVSIGFSLLIALLVFVLDFENTVYTAESHQSTDYFIQQKLDNGFFVLKFTNLDKYVLIKPGNGTFYFGDVEDFIEDKSTGATCINTSTNINGILTNII